MHMGITSYMNDYLRKRDSNDYIVENNPRISTGHGDRCGIGSGMGVILLPGSATHGFGNGSGIGGRSDESDTRESQALIRSLESSFRLY